MQILERKPIPAFINLAAFWKTALGRKERPFWLRRCAAGGPVYGEDGKPEQPEVHEREVIDAKEAARRLHVSVGMIYKLLRQRKLEGYEVGKKKLLYADSIDDFRQRSAIRLAPAPEAVPADRPRPRHRQRQRREPVKTLDLPLRRHLR